MRWNGYLLTSGVNLDTAVRSIRRTRFPIRVQNLAICDRDLWPFDLEQLSYMAGYVTNLATVWVITFPIGYHWKCVRGYWACAESRNPWVGGQKQLHIWNARPRFTYTLCKCGGSTMKIIKVICENNARPCVKRRTCMSFCACAKSRDLLKVP